MPHAQVAAKIQKAAAARSALEAALLGDPVQLEALEAALEAARGARGLLDDALLAAADSAQQRLEAQADALQAEALAAHMASVARLTERDPLVAQPAQSADRSFVTNGSGPARIAADPLVGLQPHPRQPGDPGHAFGWDRPVAAAQLARPPGPAVPSSQHQHPAPAPAPPHVPLSMAAFLPAEVPQQAPSPAPPRELAFAAPLQPPPSQALGWGAGGATSGPALSNGHGYGAGGGGPFGGGLFGLGNGAFAARQQHAPAAADAPPPAASAAAPALYTPFGGVGSAFGAVTLPPPVPLQTAFGALPGADLQSLWQPGAVLTEGGADRESQ